MLKPSLVRQCSESSLIKSMEAKERLACELLPRSVKYSVEEYTTSLA